MTTQKAPYLAFFNVLNGYNLFYGYPINKNTTA